MYLYIYTLLGHNKEIMPYTVTWIDWENVIFSEVSQTENKYDTSYIWNLNNNTKESIYKIVTYRYRKQIYG